jgi:hypothetical protein
MAVSWWDLESYGNCVCTGTRLNADCADDFPARAYRNRSGALAVEGTHHMWYGAEQFVWLSCGM